MIKFKKILIIVSIIVLLAALFSGCTSTSTGAINKTTKVHSKSKQILLNGVLISNVNNKINTTEKKIEVTQKSYNVYEDNGGLTLSQFKLYNFQKSSITIFHKYNKIKYFSKNSTVEKTYSVTYYSITLSNKIKNPQFQLGISKIFNANPNLLNLKNSTDIPVINKIKKNSNIIYVLGIKNTTNYDLYLYCKIISNNITLEYGTSKIINTWFPLL